jgi:hypothetical protein
MLACAASAQSFSRRNYRAPTIQRERFDPIARYFFNYFCSSGCPSVSRATVRDLAIIALEVATVTPFKKRRLKVLAQKRPDLMAKLEETGLILAHHID